MAKIYRDHLVVLSQTHIEIEKRSKLRYDLSILPQTGISNSIYDLDK